MRLGPDGVARFAVALEMAKAAHPLRDRRGSCPHEPPVHETRAGPKGYNYFSTAVIIVVVREDTNHGGLNDGRLDPKKHPDQVDIGGHGGGQKAVVAAPDS